MNENPTHMYEIGYLLLDSSKESEILDGVRNAGGTIRDHRDVTEIRLAYPIEKHESAHFGVCYFETEAGSETVSKVDDLLKASDNVLRYLLVSRVMKKAPEEKKEVKRQIKESAAAPAPAGAVPNEVLEEKLEEILK